VGQAPGSTVRPLEQEMLSGHVEGQALKMFSHMTVLEVFWTLGCSLDTQHSLWQALPADGRLVACEVDQYVADFAQALF